jgi:hypothetical protein
VKIAHHGSKKNTSVALLKLIDCPRWLISTNGDHFNHPDKECVARIIKYGKPAELWFNYRNDHTAPWLAATTQAKYRYRACTREDQQLSALVEL